MPIHLPEPPSEAAAAVADRLQTVASSETPNRAALGGSDATQLQATDGHRVFNLGLHDLLNVPDPLEAARPVGWRYLLGDGADTSAAALTTLTPEGEHKFASFNSGPYVGGTVEALAASREMPEVADDDLEVRLLTVPGLGLTALWLHGDTRDLLVPIAPAPDGVETGRQHDARELLASLTDQARERVEIGRDDERGS
jgi:hypothetical protein